MGVQLKTMAEMEYTQLAEAKPASSVALLLIMADTEYMLAELADGIL
jgi:hypothetical protein